MKRSLQFATIFVTAFTISLLLLHQSKEQGRINTMLWPEGLNVICSHASERCHACTTMERLVKTLLESSFSELVSEKKIIFHSIDYESPELADFCSEYGIATASVILVKIKNGKQVLGINLADEAWKHYNNDIDFQTMLQKHIQAMLEGRLIDTENETPEIIFENVQEHVELGQPVAGPL